MVYTKDSSPPEASHQQPMSSFVYIGCVTSIFPEQLSRVYYMYKENYSKEQVVASLAINAVRLAASITGMPPKTKALGATIDKEPAI